VEQFLCSGLRPEVSLEKSSGTADIVLLVPRVLRKDEELALALLVARVLADDHDASVATDDLALVANLLDAGLDLHEFLSLAVVVPPGRLEHMRARGGVVRPLLTVRATCSGKRSGRGSDRMGSAPRSRGPRGGCGCSAGASCR
jgi:hypothetical protein